MDVNYTTPKKSLNKAYLKEKVSRINGQDTSISRSKQLEAAVPPSKISSLSSGEFVGMVADDPENKIELKTFHCEIINDHQLLKRQESQYNSVPVLRKVDASMIHRNYLQIKDDIDNIKNVEIEKMINDPACSHIIIRKIHQV